MQPSKLLCPHCGAVLRSNNTLAVGQAVECVKCGAPFTVSAADLTGAEAGPISVVAQAIPQAGEFVLEGAPANGTAAPRMGLLEGASHPVARPMPLVHHTGVLTAMPAAPPRK